jgi:Transmembrane family 220, helix
MIFRVANVVMALLCFVSVALQYNDPDPLPWMAIWGVAGVFAALAAFGRHFPWWMPAAIGAVAVVWGTVIAVHLRGRFAFSDLVKTMEAETPQIEESRESLGLYIITVWMAVLAVWATRSLHG